MTSEELDKLAPFVDSKTLKQLADPVPVPDPALLYSMALRYRHDFGLIEDEREREAILTTMRQLWEEVVGLGFYKPKS